MPEPPLFVSSDDLMVFGSVDGILRYIEPWDVAESDRAWDSTGRSLALRAKGVRRTRWTVSGGTTFIDFSASGDDQAERLEQVLREWMKLVGLPRFGWTQEHLDHASLHDLASAVGEFEQLDRRRRRWFRRAGRSPDA